MSFVSVHYHELALKGGNRARFERRLRQNLAQALRPLGRVEVRSLAGRIVVETDTDPEPVVERVTRVFGVAYAAPVERLPRDLAAVGEAAIRRFRAAPPKTFRVRARRVDKRFPKRSPEIEREVGAIVHETLKLPVSLSSPDAEAVVTVMEDEILLALDRTEGPGGLPVGTGGRVAVLLSGGIDSPVAAWRLMKRGCTADLVHFHSHPLVDRTTQEKARDLAEVLTRWQYRTRLHLVPLAQIQTEVRLRTPEPLRVVLYRRFMMRLAEAIARSRRCLALGTGESIGQVASQTLANLATIDAVAGLPVLRPLSGSDKKEIVAEAERIGTYPISIRKDQDSCRLFVPAHPATKTTPRELERAEEALDVAALVRDAVERTEVCDLVWPEEG